MLRIFQKSFFVVLLTGLTAVSASAQDHDPASTPDEPFVGGYHDLLPGMQARLLELKSSPAVVLPSSSDESDLLTSHAAVVPEPASLVFLVIGSALMLPWRAAREGDEIDERQAVPIENMN